MPHVISIRVSLTVPLFPANLVAFKALAKLMLDVGLLLAYHCDKYGA